MVNTKCIGEHGEKMTIVVDTREQAPFDFLQCGADIETARAALSTGDYSLAGLETRIAVERKSLFDLVQCLGAGRARFERELQRAAALESFCVVVESTWQALVDGKYRSNLNPGAACASIAAFSARYGIAFHFAGNRAQAERYTALYLRQYLRGKAHELDAIRQALGADFSGMRIKGAGAIADAHTGTHEGAQELF